MDDPSEGANRPEASGGGRLLTATGVSKSFGGVHALREVDFDLEVGEVHALLGPNGAGKSTLIKVLNGVETADSGTIRVSGRIPEAGDIATVFQELSLVPTLNVVQNIFLNDEIHSFGVVNRRKMLDRAREVAVRLGMRIGVTEVVGRLSMAEQQLVEIAKAVHRDASVLILDEPTATLTKSDQLLLFERLRDIQKAGVGIIYVTHRLPEVFELADRVTVIRDGRRTLTARVGDLDMRQLVSAISGEDQGSTDDIQEAARMVSTVPRERADVPLLEVRRLSGDRFHDVSLTAHSGEVVGIAGLIGAGRTELLETIAGVRRRTGGEIKVAGSPGEFRDPGRAIAAGVALVPEDRHGAGVVLEHSVQSNLVLAHHRAVRLWGGFIDGRKAKLLATRVVDSLQIKAASLASPLSSLSGGNQQKVVFGKWLQARTKVLLLDEPTQGVDVRARQEIHFLIRDLADRGATALVVSSDFDELQQLCDRVYFSADGTLNGQIAVTSETTGQLIYSSLNERLGRNGHS